MRKTMARRGMVRSRVRAVRESAGVVLVETSICVMILAIFALGVAEYGNLFGSAIDVSGAVRSAARTGAATTTQPVSDDQIIQAAVSQRGGGKRSLSKIVIFEASASTSVPHAQCLSSYPPPAGVTAARKCNVYVPADFNKTPAQLMASQGFGWPWDEASRQPGTGLIGVYVEVSRTPLEKLVWSPTSYRDHMAMVVEPIQTAPTSSTSDDFGTGTDTDIPWNDEWWCWNASDPDYTGNHDIDCNEPTGDDDNGGDGGNGS